jgi:hypothetical protein
MHDIINSVKCLRLVIGVIIVAVLFPSSAVFAQYNSSNYKVNEAQFGTGGDLDSASANYKAQTSTGSLGVGNVTSTNYTAYSGFLTPNEPFLEFAIDSSTVNLGYLSTSAANAGTATFHVRTYVASGYTIQTMSQPPTMTSGLSTHTLTPMSVLGSSIAGTEQFGMNLRANTSPTTFGADPVPFPDSSFASGQATSGYNTPNQYKYVVGDTIADSGGSGWGLTTFTISYIANIQSLTPSGQYTMVHDLVVVATY